MLHSLLIFHIHFISVADNMNVFTECTDLRYVVHIHYSLCLLMWFKMVEQFISLNVSDLWCCFCVFWVFLFVLPYLSVLCNEDFSFSIFVLVFVPRDVDIDLYVHCFLFIVYCFPFLVCMPAPFSYQFKVCTWPLVSDCFQLYVHVVLSMYLYPLLLNLWYWFVFGVSVSLCSGRLLNVCTVILDVLNIFILYLQFSFKYWKYSTDCHA